MTVIAMTDELYAVLHAARRMDLWQEDDHTTTNEYRREVFGLSDPVRDVTAQADAAAQSGLIELNVCKYGSRMWRLTDAGREWLGSAEQDAYRCDQCGSTSRAGVTARTPTLALCDDLAACQSRRAEQQENQR